jgi:hypothetical protein
MEAKDTTRIAAAEVKFMRRTAKYTLMNHRCNDDVSKAIERVTSLDQISKYKTKWTQHVDRVQRNGLHKPLKE